jgi:antitoxin MazE
MPAHSQVARWGNSLAVRLPRNIVKDAGFAEGDQLSLDLAKDGAIVLRSTRRKYSLDELVSGITPKNRHREVDWGKPRGKEVW